jgi:transposase
MSLYPQAIPPVPEETARIARAAFPKGSLYIQMRDKLGSIYDDETFSKLYPRRGQPAEPPWRLALITIMQYVENLSDRQASEAVRGRIDWKYALSLELTDDGFDFSVLSEFRSRLVAGKQEAQLLNRLLEVMQAKGWLKSRGKQRTDSTHVLAAIRALHRSECVGETLRHALNILATVVPQWLSEIAREEWFERYRTRTEASRLPQSTAEKEQWLIQVGADGHQLLAEIYQPDAPEWLRQIPAVEILRQVWVQQYYIEAGQLFYRQTEQLPPQGQLIASPYDVEVRNRKKRNTLWTGYCVHLTEACDDSLPNLITNVETTAATVVDGEMTPIIHQHLECKKLLPGEHYVDTAYIDAEHLVNIPKTYGVELVGPAPSNPSWQAQAAQGFDVAHFIIDWQKQQVRCPQGQLNRQWNETINQRGQPVIRVRFSRKHCQVCPSRLECTQAQSQHGRSISLLPYPQHQALQAARQYQQTPEFQRRYATRAGVEGCLSQGIRAFGLRRSRYVGLAKTHLQHIVTAVAMNLVRLMHWWEEIPKAATRVSRFRALAPGN